MVHSAMRFVRLLIGLGLMPVLPSWAAAQAMRDAKVIITVVDPTGGVIPGATVTLVGLEAATKASPIAPVGTTDRGVATSDGVKAGRYSIQAEFQGFDLGLVRDIRINGGENRRVVMLPFKNRQESVTVGGGQEAAASRNNSPAFGLALTNEQVDALSDDHAKFFNWRRLTANGGYSWIRARRNADDAFSVPPSGTLDTEWGPGPADLPYRINANITSTQIRNLSINLNISALSGQVYTWTTGLDNNHDGFYNNLTNHANLTGYDGNQLSEYFMQATAVQNPRRVDVGMNLNF